MFTFNAGDFDPQAGLPVIPPGDYHFCIRKSNVKETQAKTGGMLSLQYECLTDGPQKGKMAFNNLNLWNPNQQTVEIAQKELSAICHATGVHHVQATQQPDQIVGVLHDKPFMCRVTVGSLPGGGETNRFTNYRRADGSALTRGNFGGAGPSGPQPVPQGAPQQQPQQTAPQPMAPQQMPTAAPRGGFPGAPGMPQGGQQFPGQQAAPGGFPGQQAPGGFAGAPGMQQPAPGQFQAAPQQQMPGMQGGGFPGAPAPQQQQPQGQFPGAPQQQPQGGFPGAPGQQPWGPQG